MHHIKYILKPHLITRSRVSYGLCIGVNNPKCVVTFWHFNRTGFGQAESKQPARPTGHLACAGLCLHILDIHNLSRHNSASPL